MLKLAKAFFLEVFRDFGASFWILIFPMILYLILSTIFGNAGSEDIELKLGVVMDEELTGMGKIIEKVLNSVSGENGIFKLEKFQTVDEALKRLEDGELDVVLRIPKKTSEKLSGGIIFGRIGFLKSEPASLQVYYVEERAESRVAVDVLSQIFEKVNLEIVKRSKKDYIDFETKMVEVKGGKFNYNLYLFPGVIIMAVLSISVFSLPIGFTEMREKKVVKKIYSTPVKPLKYFFAYILAMLWMALMSTGMMYAFAMIFRKLDPSIFKPTFLILFLYSILVLFSFGLMLSSFVRRSTTAIAVGNVMNYVMMFMGGLFFPVFNFPWSLRWLVYIIPTTYLAEALRKILGQNLGNFSWTTMIGIPALWFVLSLILFILNFKKVMGYE